MNFCQIHTFFLAVLVGSLELAQADLRHVIKSPPITNWGKWGEFDRCPEGYFVTGMQLKVEGTEGWKDDTGLNGIKFFCSKLGDHSDLEDSFNETISSSIGDYGQWKKIFKCHEHHNLNKSTTVIVGFQLRSESKRCLSLMQDDTSANNLRVFCSDFSKNADAGVSLKVEGDGTDWGRWTQAQFCKEGYAICGIKTQIDKGRGRGYDDTSLNNLNAECCEVKLMSSSSGLGSFEAVRGNHSSPDLVKSAINFHHVLQNSTKRPEAQTPPSTESANSQQSVEKFSSEAQDISYKDVKSALTISTTESYTILPNLTALSDELKRLADIDFNSPIITTTTAPTQDTSFDNIETVSQDNFEPAEPSEVIQFLGY